MKESLLVLLCLFMDYLCMNPLPLSAQTIVAKTNGLDTVHISNLPSIPLLPKPLIIDEGGKNIPITTMQQWKKKRKWIKKKYQYWISGTRPPAPKSFHVKVLSSKNKKWSCNS